MALTRRDFLKFAGIGATAFALTACGSETAAETSGETGTEETGSQEAVKKEITVGWGKLDTLDSRNSVSADAYQIISMIQDGLFRNVNSTAVNALCETYEVNDTNTEYTFHLRESNWADGTPVTAHDFEYAVKSLLNPDNACAASTVSPAYYLTGASERLFYGGAEENVGIQAADDYTLTMSFVQSIYPIQLADRTLMPIRQATLEAAADGYGATADALMANGPFTVSEWGEDKIVLVKNETYWDVSSIHLDSITFLFGANYETGLDMMLSGEVQMTYLNNANQITAAQDAGYTTYDCYGGYEYFYINHQGSGDAQREFIQNTNFRLALSAALDRQALVTTVFTADQVADRLIDGNERGKEGNFVDEYPYTGWSTTADVESAQKYMDAALAELGKSADEIPTFSILSTSGPENANVASAVDEMWSKIGVHVEYDGQEFSGYVTKAYSGEFDFMLLGTERSLVDWFEAQGKYFVSPASALVYYESEEYDALAEKVTGAQSWDERKDAMFELEKFVTEQALVLDIANIDIVYTAVPELTNVGVSMSIDLTYADLQ